MQQQYHKMMKSSPFRRPEATKNHWIQIYQPTAPISFPFRPYPAGHSTRGCKKTLKYRPKAETDYQIRNNGGTQASACVFCLTPLN